MKTFVGELTSGGEIYSTELTLKAAGLDKKPWTPIEVKVDRDVAELDLGVRDQASVNFYIATDKDFTLDVPRNLEAGKSGQITVLNDGLTIINDGWALLAGQSHSQEGPFLLSYYCTSDDEIVGTIWR